MMEIIFTPRAALHYEELKNNPSKARIFKDVKKTLKLMESNIRHPSLNTHEFYGLEGPNGEKVFEAYAQQKTAGAYRIFWYYGPERGEISIAGITPHP